MADITEVAGSKNAKFVVVFLVVFLAAIFVRWIGKQYPTIAQPLFY